MTRGFFYFFSSSVSFENNIFCNVYFADTTEGYKEYFEMGIDTILTNRMDIAAQYQK